MLHFPFDLCIPDPVVESSFNDALKDELPWKSLHIASLTQEAFIVFNFVTARFRLGGGAKIKKGDPVSIHSFHL
jgi:hypothetical protein